MQTKVVVLSIIIPHLLLAGFERNGIGARPIALANAFVAGGSSSWSTVYNPAGLSLCNNTEARLFLSPKQFGLKELSTIAASCVVPFSGGAVGVVATQFGSELYRETELAVGSGVTLEDGIAVGATINLQQVNISRYGSSTLASYDIGGCIDICPGVVSGFAWKNVTATRIARTGESVPQILSTGLRWDLSPDTHLSMGLEKDIRFPFSFRLGFEHTFQEVFTFRFGMSNNPDKISAGLAIRFSGFECSYAGYSHPQLGWSHLIEVSFRLDS